ncbi:glucose-1-phosphate adenylyltransferase subunit GlgD [Traorella massiliensis]|uniref:glucose-1-phosphate adenylyltransferase subunit GlgD n=1 Tax=Traorella massiliensis TaxID=1903263 RepID=UPI0023544A13|nr:glucose-1-phosphate adenylyltransferase subunit GlgD [Traorella massiliensis]
MCNALGIVNFPGSNVRVKGMHDYRPIAAFSFLGRYRMIDFPLSNMTNSEIEEIQIYLKNRPRSVFSHVGTGRHYNINSKRGGISILYGENSPESEFYNTDIASFKANMRKIAKSTKDYVVIAPSYMLYSMNYDTLLKKHLESGADITVVYKSVDDAKTRFIDCDTLNLNKQKGILSFGKNRGNYKTRNISMETYVLSKNLFMQLVDDALKESSLYWFTDILNEKCEELDIRGYQYRGFLVAITDLTSYYEANMELIDPEVAVELFKEDWPIYTRTNDSAPTKYTENAKVRRCVISNGCMIDGEVENSIIGRGCVVKKGAVVKNAVICPNTVIGEDVYLNNIVVDKEANISRVKNVQGVCGSPAYVRKGDRI